MRSVAIVALVALVSAGAARGDRKNPPPNLFALVDVAVVDVVGTIEVNGAQTILREDRTGTAVSLPSSRSKSDVYLAVGAHGRLLLGPANNLYDAAFVEDQATLAVLAAYAAQTAAKTRTAALVDAIERSLRSSDAADTLIARHLSDITKAQRRRLRRLAASTATTDLAPLRKTDAERVLRCLP